MQAIKTGKNPEGKAIKILMNQFGNWSGYLSGRKVKLFDNDSQGTQKQHAEEWFNSQVKGETEDVKAVKSDDSGEQATRDEESDLGNEATRQPSFRTPASQVKGESVQVSRSHMGGLAAKLSQAKQPNQVGTGPKPTAEQETIIAAVQNNDPVLVVEAGAGAGKTSTLKMIGQTRSGRGQYTAFNSSLVAESKSKFVGLQVACNTTHSLAFQAEGIRFAHRLDSHRVRGEQIAKMLGIEELVLPFGEGQKRLAPGFLASQVMGAIRRFCQSADSEVSGNHFKYLDGIDLPVDGQRRYTNNMTTRDTLLPFAQKAWKDLSSEDGQLPFSHDHYVKIWQLNNPVISADYILLDEAQDTAPVMLDILKQQTCPIILVGDSAQQIYEWRGAVNALGAFGEAPRLMLSQSFRFGPAIAEVANAVLATLEEPTALRLKGFDKIKSRVEEIAHPVAILCRTNGVAIATLLSSIADGKKPFLIGGGSETIAFVEAAQKLQNGETTSHPDLACFSNWGEVQQYVKQEEGEDLKLMVKIIDEFGSSVILEALRGMVKEEAADIVISTAHKSKGREWKSVKLAADFPTKSKCCDADRKLLYVAVTRAQEILDVTTCPFFSGKDSLDIKSISNKYKAAIASGDIELTCVPESPSTPPAPTQFTWASKDGKWFVKGPKGQVNQMVMVHRKDGSSQSKTLRSVVQEFDSFSFYGV